MTTEAKKTGAVERFLNVIEVVGNKLPDPAVLFLLLMSLIWLLSWPLSAIDFGASHPVTGDPIQVANQVNGAGIANLLSSMINTFVNFAPLGVVLVAILGIGVAERTGFINAMIKTVLSVTSKSLLTPVLIIVGVASHYAVDAGYVLVIPLGGVIFYSAGRHPPESRPRSAACRAASRRTSGSPAGWTRCCRDSPRRPRSCSTPRSRSAS